MFNCCDINVRICESVRWIIERKCRKRREGVSFCVEQVVVVCIRRASVDHGLFISLVCTAVGVCVE